MNGLPVLPDGIEAKDYWAIQAGDTEWIYVVSELMKRMKDVEDKETPIVIIQMEPPVYLLRKKYIPVEHLSKVLGMTPRKIEALEMIVLRVKPTDLPKPNVNYWGTA